MVVVVVINSGDASGAADEDYCSFIFILSVKYWFQL